MRIDIYHDTACPWCRIGKRHLKLALESWQGEPVELFYHTFFLNADIPAGGYDFRQYMTAKGGGQVPLEQWFAAPRERGASVGLTFNFDRITRAPNTLLSHRLIALAPTAQKEAIIDAVYAAYFEFGRDIGSLDVLVDIAAANGMDADETRALLESDAGTTEVMNDALHAQQIGISGVPFFVIDNTFAFSGAHPPAAMLRALRQVKGQQEAKTS